MDDNDGGEYTLFHASDIENVNPIDYYSQSLITMYRTNFADLIILQDPNIPRHIAEKVAHQEATKDWLDKLEIIENTEIPSGLTEALTASSKKEQVRALKGISLSNEQLLALIFKAYKDHGFTFSQYFAKHTQKGLDERDLPILTEIQGDRVHKIGETSLTDGQLKQAVEHKKATVAKFLDKGDSWHCFFLTHDSLRGKENWKDGQPHFHYISNKFGIARKDVVEQLKSRTYKLGNLPHINLTEYER